jgi:hypothetical protein
MLRGQGNRRELRRVQVSQQIGHKLRFPSEFSTKAARIIAAAETQHGPIQYLNPPK